LVGEAESGFVITTKSCESGALSSDGVKLVCEVTNLSGKGSILVGEDHYLVVKVSDSCFSIGKSSLKRRAFSSKGIALSSQVSDLGRESGILIS
jgi:hypothetical protein